MAFEFKDHDDFSLVRNPSENGRSPTNNSDPASSTVPSASGKWTQMEEGGPQIVSVVSMKDQPKDPPRQQQQGTLKAQKVRKKPGPKPGNKRASSTNAAKEELKSYVATLVAESLCPEFKDKDFAERALMNLGRRLVVQEQSDQVLSRFKRAAGGNSEAGCVIIPRPRDGRLTVAKSNVASTKKVFPQVRSELK